VWFTTKLAQLKQWVTTLLHKGHGSGVDADKLDGLHADDVVVKAAEIAGARRDGSMLGITDHGVLQGLSDDDHTQYALADKSRPATWVAETDVPVLTDAKYPNAVLRDGTRAMTGNLSMGAYGVHEDSLRFAMNRGAGAFEFKYLNAVRVALYRVDTATYMDLLVRDILPTRDAVITNTAKLRTATTNGHYFTIEAQDAVGMQACAKLVSGYMDIMRAGDITLLVDKKVDCQTNGGELHPARESTVVGSEPTPSVHELMIWRDSTNNKVYLKYNDTDEGDKKVELT
jgi:hypothetical protein